LFAAGIAAIALGQERCGRVKDAHNGVETVWVTRSLAIATLVLALVAGASVVPTPAEAAVCADYATQQEAQERADTIDADGDGLFCESLPCPCSTASPNTTTPSPADKPAKTYTYTGRVTQVIDGDTIKVRYDGRVKTVRVIGIDTPESHKPNVPLECGAKEATSSAFRWAFAKQLDFDKDGLYDHGREGRTVTLRTDNSQSKLDQYGRLLAYVSRGSSDFGRTQVSKGWAQLFVFESNPFKRFASYDKSAKAAQAAGRGIWNSCGGDFHSAQ
jgi:micrococcal nuclease